MKFMRHSFYFYINKNIVLDIDSDIPWQMRPFSCSFAPSMKY